MAATESLPVENKKIKLDPSQDAVKLPNQCAHWVQRKKRFCKMTVSKGHEYCGEHVPATAAHAEPTAEAARIPCPLDAKHTVYKNKLQKHLQICNARQRVDEPPYIRRAVNAGQPLENQQNEEQLRQLKLSELSDEEFYATVAKVRELYAKHFAVEIEELNLQHDFLAAELSNADYGKELRKHLLQNAALLGILQQQAQLQANTSFIEFGAGKGHLASQLAQLLQQQQLPATQVVLLDRMSLRHKRDNKIADRELVQRLRVDIADFCMSELPLLQKTLRTVAFSKHLCGGATDLALRCIEQAQLPADKALNTDFILIALCCHHRCDWRSFVGKAFCQLENISQRQFAIMTKMVSWSICGTGMSRERRQLLAEQQAKPPSTELNNQRLSMAEREQVGFMCKRILDQARVHFLRQCGYEATLKYYVPKDVTLENVCLLAKRVK